LVSKFAKHFQPCKFDANCRFALDFQGLQKIIKGTRSPFEWCDLVGLKLSGTTVGQTYTKVNVLKHLQFWSPNTVNNIKLQCCCCQDGVKSHHSKGDCVPLIQWFKNHVYCFRYLEGYEKLYFLGEDGDDSSVPRVGMYSPSGYGLPHMPMMHRGMSMKPSPSGWCFFLNTVLPPSIMSGCGTF
jgi:hypothetical protein